MNSFHQTATTAHFAAEAATSVSLASTNRAYLLFLYIVLDVQLNAQ
jgi:hypothetical protein